MCCRRGRWTLCYILATIATRKMSFNVGLGMLWLYRILSAYSRHWTTANCWMGRRPSVSRWRQRRALYGWQPAQCPHMALETALICRQHLKSEKLSRLSCRELVSEAGIHVTWTHSLLDEQYVIIRYDAGRSQQLDRI